MLGGMTKEYAELLTRLAVDQEPLQIGQELHVGQLPSKLQCDMHACMPSSVASLWLSLLPASMSCICAPQSQYDCTGDTLCEVAADVATPCLVQET